jgi:hypothetical protein
VAEHKELMMIYMNRGFLAMALTAGVGGSFWNRCLNLLVIIYTFNNYLFIKDYS